MIGNTIIIGALLLNRKDRKNHEKRATKRSHQYMNIFWVRFFLVPLLLLLLHVARLSIDLFDRPKIRDMHINKANFLLSFFPYSLPFYAASCCSVHFFTILATVRLTWHKLIRWIDIFFFVHMPRIFITCKVHIIFVKRRLLYIGCDGSRGSTRVCLVPRATNATRYYVQHILILNNDVLTR